jgi:hypothetical protein
VCACRRERKRERERERKERKERKRCVRVPTYMYLGGRLGGVAHRIKQIRYFPHGFRLVAHLYDATGVVGDGSEEVHGQDVHGG